MKKLLIPVLTATVVLAACSHSMTQEEKTQLHNRLIANTLVLNDMDDAAVAAAADSVVDTFLNALSENKYDAAFGVLSDLSKHVLTQSRFAEGHKAFLKFGTYKGKRFLGSARNARFRTLYYILQFDYVDRKTGVVYPIEQGFSVGIEGAANNLKIARMDVLPAAL